MLCIHKLNINTYVKTAPIVYKRFMAKILATPQTGLVDEPFKISVSGLDASQLITISCRVSESERHFESYAYYKADNIGTVHVDCHPSLGGSYRGVEPHGLVWSMTQNPGQQPGQRILKQNAEEPFEFKLSVIEGHDYTPQSISQLLSNDKEMNDGFKCLDETLMFRLYQSPAVKTENVRLGKLRGRIFIPEGEGPFPAVIDMFGTNGGLVTSRSALLASRGIMSYALPYFRYDDLPDNVDIDFEYFEKAIELLYDHPLAMKTGIGVIGVSKGAGLALEMAVRSPKVLVSIAINTLAVHAVGIHHYKGVELPCYNSIEDFEETEEGIMFENSVRLNENTYEKIKEFLIPIEKSENADFVFVNGEDDHCVEYAQLFYLENLLEKNGMRHRCYSLSYPGTGHLIEPPYMPLCRSGYTRYFGTLFLYGGQPKEHSIAQEDSWRFMMDFIRYKIDPRFTSNHPPTSMYLRKRQ